LDYLILKIKSITILRKVEKHLPVNTAQLLKTLTFSKNYLEKLILQEVYFGLRKLTGPETGAVQPAGFPVCQLIVDDKKYRNRTLRSRIRKNSS
jgi:hypothetical protein